MSHTLDITYEQLQRFKKLTPYPEILDRLVKRARETIGFFNKHPSRAIEYPWVFNVLETAKISSVVDIGAGVSVLPFVLADEGIDVTTVDYSSIVRTLETKDAWGPWGFLDYALLRPGIKSYNADLCAIDFESKKFDACYTVSVIEHMPRSIRVKMIERVSELIREGGIFVVTLDLEPQTYKLWNRDRGMVVEEEKLHGTLNDFLEECRERSFQIVTLEVKRKIPGAFTDVVCCAFKRMQEGKGKPDERKAEAAHTGTASTHDL